VSVVVQYDLFKTPTECEMECLRKTIDETKKTCEKVRKGTYARLNDLTRECVDLKIRLEIMERHICLGGK